MKVRAAVAVVPAVAVCVFRMCSIGAGCRCCPPCLSFQGWLDSVQDIQMNSNLARALPKRKPC